MVKWQGPTGTQLNKFERFLISDDENLNLDPKYISSGSYCVRTGKGGSCDDESNPRSSAYAQGNESNPRPANSNKDDFDAGWTTLTFKRYENRAKQN